MDNYKKAFGLRVRALRKEMRFSQERLASIAGLDRSYVGGIERGNRNPSLKNICEIAKALGVDPAELFPKKPLRIPREDNGKSDVRPTEVDELWGYGDAVAVPAITWIDDHVLTPLHERSIKARRPS